VPDVPTPSPSTTPETLRIPETLPKPLAPPEVPPIRSLALTETETPEQSAERALDEVQEEVDAGAATELVVRAYPLTKFSEVNSLLPALRELPGMRSVRLRRLTGGVLLLDVIYSGRAPLDTRLASLAPQFPELSWQVEPPLAP